MLRPSQAEQAKAGGSKGGAKGGPKVGYHPPAGLVSGGGVATFNAPAQPAPVAGSGAVGTERGHERQRAKSRCAEAAKRRRQCAGWHRHSRHRPAEAARELIEADERLVRSDDASKLFSAMRVRAF